MGEGGREEEGETVSLSLFFFYSCVLGFGERAGGGLGERERVFDSSSVDRRWVWVRKEPVVVGVWEG